MKSGGYNKLINQIDAFIKKYYKNLMVKGGLLFLFFGGLAYLSVVLLEYFGRFNTTTRAILFYGFVGLGLFLLIKYVIIPLTKLLKIGNTINHEQASQIIGSHFPGVDDKLLNTLQLRNDYVSGSESELLMASIEQRSEDLSVVPFSSAIKLDENKKYLIYLLPVLLIFGVLFITKPSIVNGSTARLVNYSEEFIPEAPFNFTIYNSNLTVVEGQDCEVRVKVKGDYLPEKVYVHSSEGTFVLEKESKSTFVYTFIGVKDSQEFSFSGGGYSSQKFELMVLKKPEIVNMNMELDYPDYLKRENETIENAGDVVIPEGTNITWELFTKKADNAILELRDTTMRRKGFVSSVVKFNSQINTSENYSIQLSRNDNEVTDSSSYKVDVVKDKYPSVLVQEDVDSLSNLSRFFSGNVSDDYGLSSLTFHYDIIKKDGSKKHFSKRVAINTKFNKSSFFHHIDLSTLGLETDDVVNYYFVVRDNDKPHGFKSARSNTFHFEVPSDTDLAEKNNAQKDEIKKDLESTIKKAKDFQKKIEDLKLKSLQKKNFDWKDQQQLNELINDQKSIENDLLELNQQIENNQQEQEQFNELSEDLLEKQEMIDELMENIMDEELKDLLEKLQDLMENQDKKEFDKQMENLEMDSEEMEEKLDNSLELLKRLEVEEKSEQIVNNLKKLAEEQKKLADKVKEKEISNEKAKEEQKEIEDKFKQVKDDIDRLMKKNEELEKPMDLDKQEDKQNDIQEDLNQSKENLDKNKQKKASDAQEDASEKMEEMAEQMKMQMDQEMQEQAGEDIQAMRMLLENIVSLSLDQEDVMNSFNDLSKRDPNYVIQGQVQHKIVRDTKMVEDSLRALASRVPQMVGFVNKEMKSINGSLKNSLDQFEERHTGQMQTEQQTVMTGFNNLALLLNESLEQMQKQRSQAKMSGSGSCKNPGGKGKKPSSGMSMDQMKEMLKRQIKSMQKGPNPGGQKPGDKPGQGGGLGLGNKEVSKMARDQAMMRKELKQLAQKLNKDGSGKGNALNDAIKQLEKSEKDIVNKRFTPSLIKRQKDILSRLLESEKAIREQEYDNKRKSKSGENKNNSNLILIEQYKKKKLKEIELLKSVPPSLNEYYKNKANEYINVLNR